MKWWRVGLERVFDWTQRYGWSIPAFLLGLLSGMVILTILELGADWINVATALGTLGAALAAFLAVRLTRLEQKAYRTEQREQRQPYLIVDRLISSKPRATTEFKSPNDVFVFTNLSQGPVHLRDVFIDVGKPFIFNGQPVFATEKIGVTIAMLETFRYENRLRFHFGTEAQGEVRFYFQYAATGAALHRLTIPFLLKKATKFGYGSNHFDFEGQRIDLNQEDERPPFMFTVVPDDI